MLLRFGIITEVDAEKSMARVKFDGEQGIVSYPLPMAMPGTVDGKWSIPYNVNEHVYCIMDENMEYGVIAGAVYDAKNQPNGGHNKKVAVQFAGSLRVEFDRDLKTLSIGGDGDVIVDVNGMKGNVNIKCKSAVIDSLTTAELKAVTEVKLTAPLVTVAGNIVIAGTITADGSLTSDGDITATGKVEGTEVKEGLIRLGTHKHSGVQTGGGTSGTPVP